MRTFFTSDLHLGHANIIKYTNRPFKDIDHMNKTLVYNWNKRVKEDDIVYHLGDFCFRGGKEGGLTKAQQWEKQLNGKIIHIRGNHDVNNGTKAIISEAMMEFSNKIVYATHRPPNFIVEVPDFVDFILCGHVHGLWKHKWLKGTDILMINVGVDVWDFIPIPLDEVVGYYNKITNLKTKENIT